MIGPTTATVARAERVGESTRQRVVADVVFVINRAGFERSFKSWAGSPVGTWMIAKTEKTRVVTNAEAPGPGKPPRNRTGRNYGHGVLQTSALATHRDAPNGDLEGHVTVIPKYALMVHNGTKPHIIRPKSPGRRLKFRGRTGTMVYARKVNHPGTAANPFLERALKAVM